MATLKKSRGSQAIQSVEFVWFVTDDMLNPSGVSKTFGSGEVAALAFDVIGLPMNAVVVGGDVTTETAVTGSTAYNVIVGDSGTTNRYLGTTDKTAAGRTALVPTGFVNASALPVRVTVTPTVAVSTAGKLRLRVDFIIRDRAAEVTSSD